MRQCGRRRRGRGGGADVAGVTGNGVSFYVIGLYELSRRSPTIFPFTASPSDNNNLISRLPLHFIYFYTFLYIFPWPFFFLNDSTFFSRIPSQGFALTMWKILVNFLHLCLTATWHVVISNFHKYHEFPIDLTLVKQVRRLLWKATDKINGIWFAIQSTFNSFPCVWLPPHTTRTGKMARKTVSFVQGEINLHVRQ